MRRVLAFIFRNWPLKLAAIVLATMLYVGLVLSQSAQTRSVNIPIEARGLPSDAVLLNDLPFVTEVSYVAAPGVAVSSETFVAWVDLSGVDADGGPVFVDVVVDSIDPQVRVLSRAPPAVRVDLDPVRSKVVPVVVDVSDVPPDLQTDEPVVGAETVTVRGPASIVDRVVVAQAVVTVDATALDVDRDVALVPLDGANEKVSGVDVQPETVRVTIHVFKDVASRSLPVTVPLAGSPPPGFVVGAITTDPVVVAVGGEAADLSPLQFVQTEPVSVTNETSDIVATVALDLPAGVVALGISRVEVRVPIRPVSETRLFQVGIDLTGERNDLEYAVARDRVLVTLRGSPVDLDRLAQTSFTVALDVSGLGTGSHDVPARVDLPAGLELVTISPRNVVVEVTPVTAPSPSPSPSG